LGAGIFFSFYGRIVKRNFALCLLVRVLEVGLLVQLSRNARWRREVADQGWKVI
jgi:hypothetical protein